MGASPSSRGLVTTEARSALMKQVRRAGTAPELAVRRFLHAAGLRYGLHRRDLPGRPDLVLPACRSVVWVHGCFWHGHDCTHGRVQARRNAGYWKAKIDDNRARDARQRLELEAAGWQVECVWECQLRDPQHLHDLALRLIHRRSALRGPSATPGPACGLQGRGGS